MIVLIPGFLTPKNLKSYWGSATSLGLEISPVIIVNPSGVASLHDRCCEIFAQLTGTKVDFGTTHAKEHGHARYGRMYTKEEALAPNWSEDNPLHLVGHSFGGNTARVFHHMLQSGFFGSSFGGKHVKSITVLNAPLNGALAVYAFGAQNYRHECDCSNSSSSSLAKRSSNVSRCSVGWWLGMYVHVHEYTKVFNCIYDFGMSHWPSSASLWCTLVAIFSQSPMFEGKDCANYDMTCHRSTELNQQMMTCPTTFYFSIVGSTTKTEEKEKEKEKEDITQADDDPNSTENTWLGWVLWCLGTLFMVLVNMTTKWNINRVHANMSREQTEMRRKTNNDGLVTCFSQQYPIIDATKSVPANCSIKSFHNLKRNQVKPGRWHVHHVEGHHLEMVPFPRSIREQRVFFEELFTVLRSLQQL